jgi:hypothetical protein
MDIKDNISWVYAEKRSWITVELKFMYGQGHRRMVAALAWSNTGRWGQAVPLPADSRLQEAQLIGLKIG